MWTVLNIDYQYIVADNPVFCNPVSRLASVGYLCKYPQKR